MLVRWQGVDSRCFYIANGVRQGGILSPYLFRVYVRDLISEVLLSGVGCDSRGDFIVNLLAYADDMALLAPLWRGNSCNSYYRSFTKQLRKLISASTPKKTVCMIFNPEEKCKIVTDNFPQFTLAGSMLSFVQQFKHFGHIIENTLCDLTSNENCVVCSLGQTF